MTTGPTLSSFYNTLKDGYSQASQAGKSCAKSFAIFEASYLMLFLIIAQISSKNITDNVPSSRVQNDRLVLQGTGTVKLEVNMDEAGLYRKLYPCGQAQTSVPKGGCGESFPLTHSDTKLTGGLKHIEHCPFFLGWWSIWSEIWPYNLFQLASNHWKSFDS